MTERLFGPVKAWAEWLMTTMGYPGIALLMMLDAANIPIPSEIIMPFSGILAAEGKLTFVGVGLAGTIGCVLGSISNYWLGAWLGREGLIKYGKWILLRKKEVDAGDRWFSKYGVWVTLWGRFIPLVRTFISLPAGIYRMNFGLFCLFALLGAAPWCFGWAWIGFRLGENWHKVEENWGVVDKVVLGILAFFLIRFIWKRLRDKEPASLPQE